MIKKLADISGEYNSRTFPRKHLGSMNECRTMGIFYFFFLRVSIHIAVGIAVKIWPILSSLKVSDSILH